MWTVVNGKWTRNAFHHSLNGLAVHSTFLLFSSLLLTLDRNSCVNKLLVHLLFLWAGDRGGGSASDATLRLNYGLICGLDLGLSATIFLYTVQRGTWLNL